MAGTRVESLDRDIDLLIRQDLSPEAQSAVLAEFALGVLGEAEAANAEAMGSVPTHQTFVDGREGASEMSVRPDGVIVYEFDLFRDVLPWILSELERHSPVKSGAYRASHRLFLDGTETNTQSLSGLEGGEYVFLPTVPYARKIEGNGAKRPESPAAPDGVYEVVAAIARRRFGNIAKIVFGYRAPLGGGTALEDWAKSTGQHRAGRKAAVSHWNRRQPAIIVTLR